MFYLRIPLSFIITLSALAIASNSYGMMITWEISGLKFGPDAAPVTGSFTHDLNTGAVTDVNILASAGQTSVCLDIECNSQEVRGSTQGFRFDISPFGFVPTGPLPIGAFTFTLASDFDAANSFIPPGSPLFLLAVGDLPTMAGETAIIAAGTLEFIIGPDFNNPLNPFEDPHRRMTLGSQARLVGRVPEPGALALVALGLGLGFRRLQVALKQRM